MWLHEGRHRHTPFCTCGYRSNHTGSLWMDAIKRSHSSLERGLLGECGKHFLIQPWHPLLILLGLCPFPFSIFLQTSQRPACCLPSFSLRRCHSSRSFSLCPSILSVLLKVLFCSRFTGWWTKKSLCFMGINRKKLLVRLPGPRAYHVLPEFISTKTPE